MQRQATTCAYYRPTGAGGAAGIRNNPAPPLRELCPGPRAAGGSRTALQAETPGGTQNSPTLRWQKGGKDCTVLPPGNEGREDGHYPTSGEEWAGGEANGEEEGGQEGGEAEVEGKVGGGLFMMDAAFFPGSGVELGGSVLFVFFRADGGRGLGCPTLTTGLGGAREEWRLGTGFAERQGKAAHSGWTQLENVLDFTHTKTHHPPILQAKRRSAAERRLRGEGYWSH